MTKGELEQLIFGMNSKTRLVQAFEHLTEAQRKKVSTHTNDLRLQITREKAKKDASGFVKKQIAQLKGNWQSIGRTNVQFAVYAMCPLSTIRNRGGGWIQNGSKHLFKIITDRKPAWLNDWIEFELANENGVLSFKMINAWMKKGLCDKPKSDGYTVKFSEYLQEDNREHKDEAYLSISQRIINDSSFLDDIWQLFQLEHDGFSYNYLYNFNHRYPKPESHESLTDAIVTLSKQGVLDRQRLLNEILEGLHHDIKQNQLSGMHKLHDLLKPTIDELVERQDALMAHLSSQVGHVAKFALKHLTKINKAKQLDSARFLNEVAVIFQQPAKGNAMQALKLIGVLSKNAPNLNDQVLTVLIDALQHPNIDVQTLALTQITVLQSHINAVYRDQLNAAVNFINPSLKNALNLLLSDGEMQEMSSASVTSSIEPVDRAALKAQLDQLTQVERESLGLDLIDLDLDGFGELKPVMQNTILKPVIGNAEELLPICDVDELILVVSSAIEGVADFNDFERILDGVSRLCDQRPDDFEQRVAPLRKRIENGFESYESMVGDYGGLRLVLKSLLKTWITGEFKKINQSRFNLEKPLLETTIKRIENLKNRVVKKLSQLLFAAPTHVGGWIDPVIWIERIEAFIQRGFELDRMDFCHSIMRLAPDNRKAALGRAQQLSGELARVACFVLDENSTVSLTKKDATNYDMWLTAARCKKPSENWRAFFEPLGIKADFPGGMQHVEFKTHIFIDQVDEYRFPKVEMSVYSDGVTDSKDSQPKLTKMTEVVKINHTLKAFKSLRPNNISWGDFPTMTMYRHEPQIRYWGSGLSIAWLSQWLFSIWPNHQEPFTATAIEHVAFKLDGRSSNMDPNYGFYQGLFQSIKPFDSLQHLLLAVGLLTSDKDVNFAAIDALIEGIEICQVNEQEMVDALERLAQAEFVKCNRLADSLNQIHTVSVEHAYCVSLILQGLLCRIDSKLRNLFKIMDVLLEVQTELDVPLQEQTTKQLKTFNGKNKATLTAKKLLGFEQVNKGNDHQLKLRMVERRLMLFQKSQLVIA